MSVRTDTGTPSHRARIQSSRERPANGARRVKLPLPSVTYNSGGSVSVVVITCTVSEILQVFLMTQLGNSYSTLIFGVFSFHQIAHVGVSPSVNLKLINQP